MILNGEKWHYLTVKKSALSIRGIMSKHDGNFYFLNYLHSIRTKKQFESHRKVCGNKDICENKEAWENKDVVMPSGDTKASEFNQYQKFGKTSSIIYVDLKSLIKKVNGCENNPRN